MMDFYFNFTPFFLIQLSLSGGRKVYPCDKIESNYSTNSVTNVFFLKINKQMEEISLQIFILGR